MGYDLFVLSVEKLEWEFADESDRKNVLFLNGNKTIKSNQDDAWMKILNNWDNNAQESKWIVKLLKRVPYAIGVIDGGWKKRIVYIYNGEICDNGNVIKKVEELKEGDKVQIETNVIKTLKNNEYIYELKFIRNNEIVISTLYQDSNKRQLDLWLESESEVEVEVFGKIFDKMFNHN